MLQSGLVKPSVVTGVTLQKQSSSPVCRFISNQGCWMLSSATTSYPHQNEVLKNYKLQRIMITDKSNECEAAPPNWCQRAIICILL